VTIARRRDYFLYILEPFDVGGRADRLNLEANEVLTEGASSLVMEEAHDQSRLLYVLYPRRPTTKARRVEARRPGGGWGGGCVAAYALPCRKSFSLARWLSRRSPLTARCSVTDVAGFRRRNCADA